MPNCRTSWQKRALTTVGVLCVALGILVSNASANFSGTQSRSNSIAAGTFTITVGTPGTGSYITANASDIAPGDTIERVIDLTPAGTVAFSGWTLSVTGTGNNLDDCNGTDHTNGPTCTTGTASLGSYALQVKVEVCSSSWTAGSNPYTCGGTQNTVLSARTVGFSNTALTTGAGLMSTSAINHLKVTVTFPGGSSDDDTNFQGLSTTLTFGWKGVQRAGTYQ